MRNLLSVLCCITLLAGCSWSSLNPMNWFGNNDPAPRVVTLAAPVADGSVAASSILSARADRTPAGYILQATALAPAAGAYGAVLRPAYRPDGQFSHFEFRLYLPEGAVPGTVASRTITAARFVPRGAVAGGSVTIVAAGNSVSVGLR